MKTYNPSDSDIDNHLNGIKQSLQDDVGSILSAYHSKALGFFAIPRVIFPEIDGLGSHLTGNTISTAQNIITYLKLVLSKIDLRYSKYAVFITLVYRHGLLHQHTPKEFEYKKRGIGWMFKISNLNNQIEIQRKYHLNFIGHCLEIDMNIFYHDTIRSIDLLSNMIKKDYRNTYIESVIQQTEPLNKTRILKNKNYKKFINESDFKYFKLLKLK